jgi:biopolymer transport protein ExbD
MHFTRHKRRRAPSVIIVSLIDVLLVVLIFLMVSTTFKKAESALRITMPESKQARPGAADPKALVVNLASNAPYYFLGEQPVTLDRLQKELAAATQTNPQLTVTIKSDKMAPVGEFMKVLDAAKAANPADIKILAEKPLRQ